MTTTLKCAKVHLWSHPIEARTVHGSQICSDRDEAPFESAFYTAIGPSRMKYIV